MAWNTPILTEICIGLEINGYLPAEFWSGYLPTRESPALAGFFPRALQSRPPFRTDNIRT
jgi:coenzyme PQQ precursor peptide PqqA